MSKAINKSSELPVSAHLAYNRHRMLQDNDRSWSPSPPYGCNLTRIQRTDPPPGGSQLSPMSSYAVSSLTLANLEMPRTAREHAVFFFFRVNISGWPCGRRFLVCWEGTTSQTSSFPPPGHWVTDPATVPRAVHCLSSWRTTLILFQYMQQTWNSFFTFFFLP